MFFIVYCTCQYCKDEDSSVVHFAEYNQVKSNIYPGMTLCFEVSTKTGGKNLKDYLLFGTMATYQPGKPPISRVYHYPSNTSYGNIKWVPKFYPILSSFLSHKDRRCWTFELPYMPMGKIVQYGVIVNSSIFWRRMRPWNKYFEIRLSYPGQQLTPPSVKANWGARELPKPYTMNFEIQNIVVMKRRNKAKKSCEAEWKQNDNLLIKKTLEDVNCSLPHWIMNLTLPLCKEHQLRRLQSKFFQIQHNIPPCQSIEKIFYSYDEKAQLDNIAGKLSYLGENWVRISGGNSAEGNVQRKSMFQVMLTFQGSTYTEITQIKAYDVQTLIGNAGGYVGLFLGVALIQLPSAVQYSFQMLKKHVK